MTPMEFRRQLRSVLLGFYEVHKGTPTNIYQRIRQHYSALGFETNKRYLEDDLLDFVVDGELDPEEVLATVVLLGAMP